CASAPRAAPSQRSAPSKSAGALKRLDARDARASWRFSNGGADMPANVSSVGPPSVARAPDIGVKGDGDRAGALAARSRRRAAAAGVEGPHARAVALVRGLEAAATMRTRSR